MYTSGLSYSRYRPAYYDEGERYSTHSHSSRTVPDYSWLGTSSYRPTTHNSYQSLSSRRLTDDTSSMASSKSSTDSATRRPRYARSSTNSVAQLLSDSCSSLLQKITTRVRGPSATVERQLQNNQSSNSSAYSTGSNLSIHRPIPLQTSKSSTAVPSSRNRFEDKYSSVLDRIYGRTKKEPERVDRKVEPSFGRGLAKSSTTSNVLQFSEKSYPYVNSNSVVQREKTPYRSEHKKNVYPEPSYSYLDKDSIYRVRHKSNHSELRPRRSSKPNRVGKSEYSDRKSSISGTSVTGTTTNLKLCAVEIPLTNENNTSVIAEKSKSIIKLDPVTILDEDEDVTPTPSMPDPVIERENKRKEIQSLIMKYSALDEAYNKTKPMAAAVETPSKAAVISQKYFPECSKLEAVSTTGGQLRALQVKV